MQTPLERVTKYKIPVASGNGNLVAIRKDDLAKLIAVYNAADDAVGSVYDQQYDRELRSALSALTKPDGDGE